MQKLLNFLLIVLIFTVLQVTNVGAQDTAFPGSAPVGQMDQDCAQCTRVEQQHMLILLSHK